jgi:alcohol dehydrogenase YqhD (iron-dependent ADH family)
VTATSMMFMITIPPTTSEMEEMMIITKKNVLLRLDQILKKL